MVAKYYAAEDMAAVEAEMVAGLRPPAPGPNR
jgi:hypothetical protein